MKKVKVISNILKANEQIALELKKEFDNRHIFVVNLLGSPGCGKTAVLENIIPLIKRKIDMAVIEGDVYTTKDAERIEKQGVPVLQINTSGACHLDSSMIKESLLSIPLDKIDLLVIENVGNLVCPAAYNLGEDIKMVILSITEGDDKPLKYPAMFQRADIVLINKTDLIKQTNFSLETAIKDIQVVNPRLKVMKLSCANGQGLNEFVDYLIEQVQRKKGYV